MSFEASRSQERRYATTLRKIARAIGAIIAPYAAGAVIRDPDKMMAQLQAYSEALTPWAEKVAQDFISGVAKYNSRAWASQSKKLGKELKSAMAGSSIGAVSRMLHTNQVALIKSLPIEAGVRAQDLARQAAMGGRRADEVAQEIMRTEEVTKSRATLIARTEIAKANASITQARAEYVGATHYIWRTAGDGDVRQSHREMDGKIIAYSAPPTLSDGMTGHAGEFPNCFVGSSILTGTPFVEVFYRHWYDGQTVTLTLDGGDSIEATPNHPILTPNGWKGFKTLKAGDYVVGEGINRLGSVYQHIEGFDVTMEQVFDAVDMLPAFVRSGFVGGNFHGDITNEEVEIIRPDCNLLSEVDASTLKHLRTLGFTDAEASLCRSLLIEHRGFGEFFSGADSTSAGFMSRLDMLFSLLVRHLTPLQLFCFLLSPHINACLNKASTYNGTGDIKTLGDAIFAYAILVHGNDIVRAKVDAIMSGVRFPNARIHAKSAEMLADDIRMHSDDSGNLDKCFSAGMQFHRIADVRGRYFSGHIFNLQTVSGYYGISNIQQKNCRCFAEPIITVD